MNPQLSLPSARAVFSLLFFSLILFAQPVWCAPPPTCTSTNINPGPNDPVAFFVAATSPGAVSVVDLATNTVVCSIAVGNNPFHLALSADSSLLLVENDADATVSVINLADGSTAATLNLNTLVTPGTSGITGNIATAYDGTHSFAYVAVYPNPLPATPAPVLGRINLDVLPSTLTIIGSATVGGTAPANGDIGIAFSPDGSKGYITFDGNTNVYATPADTFSASIPVTGGSFAVSPLGDLGYVVQTAATASSASPNQITTATNAFAPTTAVVGQTICGRSNTTTTSPDGSVAYYTCPANNSFQLIDTSTTSATANQVTNTLNLGTAGSTPNGIAATTDGTSLLVANGNTTISVFTSPTPIAPTTTPTETNFAGPGGALFGVGQRPVKLTLTPSTAQNVVTGTTIQFTASLFYAFQPTKLVWSVSGVAGGDSTHGTITATGLYTAPATVPSPATVTVSVSHFELPSKSLIYPAKSLSVPVTISLPVTVAVTPKPSSLNLSSATTLPFTATVANDPANMGVTWTVNGVTPGTTTTGTLSLTSTASGAATTYTAPNKISPPSSVQVTATSVSDPTASDTSTLTLSSSIIFNPIAFTPPAPLLIENTDTLSTSLTGDPYNQSVTWSIVSCSATATSACGSINSSTGLFSPPPIVPYASQSNPVAPATVTFAATSVTDPSKSSTTNPIQITSNVAFTGTGFQLKDNTGTAASQLLIETPSYTLTPVISGDTGQGVTWSVVGCSAATPTNGLVCGQFIDAHVGTYKPPSIVPYAPGPVPVPSSSVATVTFKATSLADALVSKTFVINIGSTVAITGYNLLIGTTPASPPLLIETQTPPYTFTPVITGDTGQGVTWTIVSCSAENPALKVNSKCGSVTANGAYTPPQIVPYALPITPVSTASINLQAVSIADPKIIFQPTAIAVSSTIQISMPAPDSIPALIGIPVDFTPKTNGGNVTLLNDTNQGVNLAISGTCFAPPNFGTTPTIPCGSFAGNQTSSPPLYSYTAPPVVPLAAATPAASLGTAQRAVITITATSVADPVHTASTTFSITSNISFSIPLPTDATLKNLCNPNAYSSTDANFLAEITADPCGFAVKPLAPTLAFGFPATLVESSQQGFGTVTGLTWVSTGAAPQPTSGSQTTFTAPASSGNVTITGYAIADFRKKATFSISVVASKVIPDNIAPPFTLIVASGQASGSILLDFQGPTSGQISFTCPNIAGLTNSTCAPNPNSTNASVSGTTTVTLTLSVTRGGSTYFRPPQVPGTPLRYLPGGLLALALLFFLTLVLASKNRARFPWAPVSSWRGAVAILVLCAVVLTWAGACNQFSQPSIPQPPVSKTPPATGSATVTGTPTVDASATTDSMVVPATVQP